jgi:hypothetical protein
MKVIRLLHSLLKEIQEWTALGRSRPHSSVRNVLGQDPAQVTFTEDECVI